MKRILVVLPVEPAHKARLEAAAPGCLFEYTSAKEVTQEQVSAADIIIGNAPVGLVRNAEHLQWLQLNSAGADAYCAPGVLRESCILTCATGAYSTAVSEWMLSATLMLCRKLDLYARHQAAHEWQSEGRITSVRGSTVLVLGPGDIGGAYAEKVKALGAHTIGARRRSHAEKPTWLDEQYGIAELDALLPRADIVAMVLPGTAETAHIMNAERIALMKPGAYLINAGRGNAVDLQALNEALREGRIGGAALDVTEPEPLPADSPLWDAPRCVITPHIAGQFHLRETFENIVDIAARNLACFVQGEPEQLQSVVNRGIGYRG